MLRVYNLAVGVVSRRVTSDDGENANIALAVGSLVGCLVLFCAAFWCMQQRRNIAIADRALNRSSGGVSEWKSNQTAITTNNPGFQQSPTRRTADAYPRSLDQIRV